jgi:hypothetical protein
MELDPWVIRQYQNYNENLLMTGYQIHFTLTPYT